MDAITDAAAVSTCASDGGGCVLTGGRTSDPATVAHVSHGT